MVLTSAIIFVNIIVFSLTGSLSDPQPKTAPKALKSVLLYRSYNRTLRSTDTFTAFVLRQRLFTDRSWG